VGVDMATSRQVKRSPPSPRTAAATAGPAQQLARRLPGTGRPPERHSRSPTIAPCARQPRKTPHKGARSGSRVPSYFRPACLLSDPSINELCYAALPCCRRQSHRPPEKAASNQLALKGSHGQLLQGFAVKRKQGLSRGLCRAQMLMYHGR